MRAGCGRRIVLEPTQRPPDVRAHLSMLNSLHVAEYEQRERELLDWIRAVSSKIKTLPEEAILLELSQTSYCRVQRGKVVKRLQAISHSMNCMSIAGVAKVVDIDPLGSMGLSKGSIKA
ncbi:hypothetical protein Tsp_08983 [Trichinella spiralis]|uniref:hypothetical protein n=1 Tax=Trichinella spiralis TaxID=6334 RepID=UPI0001EFC35A|nr:hypothetical protein Tsp_08983 [Trichinella spiralis]